MSIWTVRAQYDSEARVWYSVEGDMPGLLVNGATLEELADKAAAMLPDLLDVNAGHLDPAVTAGPHRIRVIAFHEREFDVAA